MNLEEEIATDLSRQMAESIDFEIIADIMCRFGWVRVDLTPFTDNYHAVDITYWLDENCKGEYKRNGRYFLFENSKDANWFRLRWLS